MAVNQATDTVYVSNSGDNTVSVINGETGTVTTTIKVGRAPFGVAVNAAAHTTYVTNETGGTVSVITN